MNPIDRQILQIALPSIVSNITVPLLGLIDVAIVGHLGSPAYIGAIAVGGMLFNIIYWIFGFLRMGTSGMTSQAYGKRDLPEIVRLLMPWHYALSCCKFLSGKRLSRLSTPRKKSGKWQHSTFISAYGALPPCWGYTDSPGGTSVCRTPAFPCT